MKPKAICIPSYSDLLMRSNNRHYPEFDHNCPSRGWYYRSQQLTVYQSGYVEITCEVHGTPTAVTNRGALRYSYGIDFQLVSDLSGPFYAPDGTKVAKPWIQDKIMFVDHVSHRLYAYKAYKDMQGDRWMQARLRIAAPGALPTSDSLVSLQIPDHAAVREARKKYDGVLELARNTATIMNARGYFVTDDQRGVGKKMVEGTLPLTIDDADTLAKLGALVNEGVLARVMLAAATKDVSVPFLTF